MKQRNILKFVEGTDTKFVCCLYNVHYIKSNIVTEKQFLKQKT